MIFLIVYVGSALLVWYIFWHSVRLTYGDGPWFARSARKRLIIGRVMGVYIFPVLVVTVSLVGGVVGFLDGLKFVLNELHVVTRDLWKLGLNPHS